jgi:16S rRNA (cytosine1402-N4)-methyltransferase
MHHPVLIDEVIVHLQIKKDGLYIDATLGEGGYTRKILELGGKVFAMDLDKAQISNFQSQISNNKNLTLVQGNFKDIEKIAKEQGFFPVDGVVFDLGLSMRQLSESGRGFSYKNENEILDMRLDLNEEQTAADYLNSLSEQNLYELFAKNAEELNSWSITRALIFARKIRKIETVGDLNRVIEEAIGKKDSAVSARIFQSLRIEVNHEFENLRKGLEGALKLIKNDGKVLVITFHSREDRIVKLFAKENRLKFETKKPVISKSDLRFERSAKLRIITK